MKQRGKKKKRIRRNEDNLRDLWENLKCPNIRITGVPEEEDKKKGHEKLLEEIIAENFPKMGKGLLRSSISSWFSFGKLYFSKNLSISSKLSILLA